MGSGRKTEPIDPPFFRRPPGVRPVHQACARPGQIPTVGTVAFSASNISVGAPYGRRNFCKNAVVPGAEREGGNKGRWVTTVRVGNLY